MVELKGAAIHAPRLRFWLLVCATALFAAVQIWLVKRYGSIIPFWDEWDVQGHKLFRPFLAGTLSFQDIIGTHNEHRPAAGRLVWLFALVSAGYWDTVWMMMLSVLIRAATFFLLARSLAEGLAGWRFVAAVAVVLAVFLVPFGWENALWGMQSATYLLLFFGVAANLCLARSPALSAGWIAGTLFAIASYFCMASGAVTLVPAIFVAGIRFVKGERRGRADLAGILIHAAIVALCLAAIPKLEYRDNIAATSFAIFWSGFLKFASWPAPESLLWVVFLNIPVAVVFGRLAFSRSRRAAALWGPVMVALWTYVNILIFAYGRGGSTEVASRHTDALMLGTAVNLALAVRLADGVGARLARYALAATACAWLAVAGWLVAQKACIQVPDGLAWRRGTVVVQTEKLAGFFAADDVNVLRGQSHAFIPYPDPDRLAADLRDPLFRPILPAAMTGVMPQHHVSDTAAAHVANRIVAVLKATMLRNAWPVVWVTGVLFALVAVAVAALDRRTGNDD